MYRRCSSAGVSCGTNSDCIASAFSPAPHRQSRTAQIRRCSLYRNIVPTWEWMGFAFLQNTQWCQAWGWPLPSFLCGQERIHPALFWQGRAVSPSLFFFLFLCIPVRPFLWHLHRTHHTQENSAGPNGTQRTEHRSTNGRGPCKAVFHTADRRKYCSAHGALGHCLCGPPHAATPPWRQNKSYWSLFKRSTGILRAHAGHPRTECGAHHTVAAEREGHFVLPQILLLLLYTCPSVIDAAAALHSTLSMWLVAEGEISFCVCFCGCDWLVISPMQYSQKFSPALRSPCYNSTEGFSFKRQRGVNV